MKVGTNPSDAAALAKDAPLASSEPSLASPASAPPTSKQPLLKEGVKASWLAAFLFASFLTIATFVYINTSQAVLLSERFGVQKSEMNRFQGNLSAVDEAVAMVMGVVWGVLSDRVGRRLVFVSGFGLMAVALLLYPTSKDIYYG